MEPPQIRPGLVRTPGGEPLVRVVARFPNSAQGNSVIQLLTSLGVPHDQLGVTPPERTGWGQGMVLSIGCPDPRLLPRVEAICRGQGAEVYRQRP